MEENVQETAEAIMERRLRFFLNAEIQCGIVLLGTGLLALGLGYFWFLKQPGGFNYGFGLGLTGFGILQTFLGLSAMLKNRKLLRILPGHLAKAPKDYAHKEQQRLESAMVEFRWKQGMALSLFVIGLSLAIFGAFGYVSPFNMGIGFAISSMLGIFLAVDLYSYFQTGLYVHEVGRLG